MGQTLVQTKVLTEKNGRYGPNTLGHDLGRVAACRGRILLYPEGFVQTVSTATCSTLGLPKERVRSTPSHIAGAGELSERI